MFRIDRVTDNITQLLLNTLTHAVLKFMLSCVLQLSLMGNTNTPQKDRVTFSCLLVQL